jgi:hypothetical protein
MTGEITWYVLDLSEGAGTVAGRGAVRAETFATALTACDGRSRYSVRVWLTPEHPELVPDAATRRNDCLLVVGSADRFAIEWRHNGERHQIGRELTGAVHQLRFNLGHTTTVDAGELFDTRTAADLLVAYCESELVPDGYHLRELHTPDILSDTGATHGLTIDYDEHRAVLPAATGADFASFLTGDTSSVLVLWPLPPGADPTDLSTEELHEEFIQTAGSADHYTVETRTATDHVTIGHIVDYLIWGTEPVDIALGDGTIQVYPNEVFTPSEVGDLFAQYMSDGQLPAGEHTTRAVPYE